ncbi:MAG TPA: ion channel, partial [Verrucomicrobiae bacterium]|nr:ion channel [Verrucomicrobiae bacterium]
MSWPGFLATLFLGYAAINTLFACVYFLLGPDQLVGAEATTAAGRFFNDFFFSAHTLTTVGYGNIAPRTTPANLVAAVEALIGVLGFAVATGLLFGRVSRPSARIGFSENMIVAPYQEGHSLQVRVVNRRKNSLAELEARLMLMIVEGDGSAKRTYTPLKLERPELLFMPLTWTIVHPIDAESPLWGKTAEDLRRQQAEVLVVLKGFDDTFNQTVWARYSYRHDEILWERRFAPAFFVDKEGDLVVEVRKVGKLV